MAAQLSPLTLRIQAKGRGAKLNRAFERRWLFDGLDRAAQKTTRSMEETAKEGRKNWHGRRVARAVLVPIWTRWDKRRAQPRDAFKSLIANRAASANGSAMARNRPGRWRPKFAVSLLAR